VTKLVREDSVAYKSLRICIFDSAMVKRNTAVFYAKPYHKKLKERKVFTKGAWCYGTSVS